MKAPDTSLKLLAGSTIAHRIGLYIGDPALEQQAAKLAKRARDLIEQAYDPKRRFYGETTNLIGVGGIQYSTVSTDVLGSDVLTVVGAELTYDDVDDAMPGYGRAT